MPTMQFLVINAMGIMLKIDKEIFSKRKYWVYCALLILALFVKINYEPKGYAAPWLSEGYYIMQYLLIQLDGWVPLFMGFCSCALGLRKIEAMISAVIQAVAVVIIIAAKNSAPIEFQVLASIFISVLIVFVSITLIFLPFIKNKTTRSFS
ncbi:MAG: hypothetical protein EOP36_13160 [Rubrivivax sp.]|nr:MAG: hypothetical protein EOP36_13160 [Rubrivivax sp.]